MVDAALQADLDALAATSRFVRSGDVGLHVLDYGGDGRPVIVLPGITSPAVTWDFAARELGPGVRPVVLDVRGRGLSDRAPGGYGLDDYADDTAAVVRELGLDAPIVLGHSMGARVAAVFAVRHPGLAGPVIVVDPPLSGPGRDPYPTTREQFLAQLHEAQAGTDAHAVRRFYPGWPQRELELRARWLPTCDEEAVLATFEGFHADDFFDVWPRVGGRPLFVRGGDSPVVTPAGEREARAALPEADFVTVAGAGHMVPWDNLKGFLAAVAPFIAGHAEGAGPAQSSRIAGGEPPDRERNPA
jgi:N-formylmaleamate deformylase